MNGFKFDSHTEEKTVELFALNIMKAGDLLKVLWIRRSYLHGAELKVLFPII